MSFHGSLLVASPLLMEPVFHRTVILILEHNEEGAIGLILNRPSDLPVVEHLPQWAVLASEPGLVYIGGPVEPDVAIGLASSDAGNATAVPGLSTLDLESDPPRGLENVRIYAGYSGWSAGQLEDEISEGAWYVVPAAPDDAFGLANGMWNRILRRQSGRLAILANYPRDPLLN